ncbi:MAG: hypothetical protein ABI540_08390 [Spartobacteria bacterium]
MLKAIASALPVFCLLVSCAAPSQTAHTQASATQSAAADSINAASQDSDDDYDTIFIPPPVGSLLGGGSVRVAKHKISGTDEKALVGNINRLNAAAGTAVELPYVVAAISRVTGVPQRELRAQQDVLRLRFGELCAINAIARGDSNKVQEIATLRVKGRSWTELAQSNGVSIGTVVKMAQNANDLTITNYTNSAERSKGGQQKLNELGIKIQRNPKNG